MSGKEKRKFPRIPYRDICHIEFSQQEDRLVQDFDSIKDLSSGGIAIESSREIPVGTRLFIHFGGDSKTPIQVKGKVVYSRALGEENFTLGIQFLSISPEDKESLEALIKKYEL